MLLQNINVTLVPDIQEAFISQPKTAAGEFQATMGGSGGDPDPDDSIDDWFTTSSKFNNFGYNDPVVNQLNAAQMQEVDRDARRLIVRELNRRISDTLHGTFTHHTFNARRTGTTLWGSIGFTR